MQVHQVHPAVSYGDAIGNEMQEIKKILNELGYESEIFAQFKNPNVDGVLNYKEYKKFSSPDNILIMHYSIGYGDELLKFVKSLPDKKILLYHNITPSHFFRGINPDYEYFTMLGRQELAGINRVFNLSLGDSGYNRQELEKLGFRNNGVLPYINDFSKYDVKENAEIINEFDDGKVNIIFVGRISPNKKIEDVIKSFYYYHKYINIDSRLLLVGSHAGMDMYYGLLKSMVDKLSLADDIYFSGHVTFDELIAYYKLADVFLCMSEHEGFCVPLLESMYFMIPIIAYRSSGIPYTMGDSGVIFDKKDYREIAEAIDLLIEDNMLNDAIVRQQLDRLESFKPEKIRPLLEQYIEQVKANKALHLDVQVEGTFEDSYSLSIINRNLALALDHNGCDVSLYATTGTGDYTPKEESIGDYRVRSLYLNKKDKPEFSIRNIYPPRVSDIKGRHKLINFFWEESEIPKEWVNDFNTLDAVIVPSNFVKTVLADCGVKSRVEVIPSGIDPKIYTRDIKPMHLNTGKTFKFLSVSSGFPRKGIDVLIKAYNEEFTKKDDVCLVIKTFPNIHNKVSEILREYNSPDSPEIIHIDGDLSDTEMVSLYRACNCFVSPTRGEGFGLPIAEAMLCKVPVIVTNYGGHVDFCNEDTAYLIDYKLERSNTHLRDIYNLNESKWAEPSVIDLRKLMRQVYENASSNEAKEKVEKAYHNILNNYSWDTTAKKVISLLEDIKVKSHNRHKNVGFVSTWNVKCGVAEYTKYFTDKLSDEIDKVILANHVDKKELVEADKPNVVRCWDIYSRDNSELFNTIMLKGLSVVHFQFNFGFFELKSLALLLNKLDSQGIKTIITFHSTSDVVFNGKTLTLEEIKDDLKKVDMQWVHSQRDVDRLSSIGLKENVHLIPQGYPLYPDMDKEVVRDGIFSHKKIISTFGFFLPHKGILELIDAFADVHKAYSEALLLICSSIYPNPISDEYHKKCEKEVKALGLMESVVFVTDYLEKDEIIHLLQASDMIVLAYKETEESSSAAVRTALASHRPVIVTDIPVFSEFNDEVYKIKKSSREEIARGIKDLYNDDELQKKITVSSTRTIEQNSWASIANKYEYYLRNHG